MATITLALVLGTDGTVDVDASVQAATDSINEYKANRDLEQNSILDAINSVFDSFPGARLNVPFIVSEALRHLNVSANPGNYSLLQERVHTFLSDNSQGKTDKTTKMVERPDSMFVIGRGKGAGVTRRADMTPNDGDATLSAV